MVNDTAPLRVQVFVKVAVGDNDIRERSVVRMVSVSVALGNSPLYSVIVVVYSYVE